MGVGGGGRGDCALHAAAHLGPGSPTRPYFMGLQFSPCTTFELIEVFIPDQPHQELTLPKKLWAKNGSGAGATVGEDGGEGGGLLRQDKEISVQG